jgi:6-phosphogluconolactonase (cycloisomerase 2 family)
MKMFRIDAATGRLTAMGGMIETPKPVCWAFVGTSESR